MGSTGLGARHVQGKEKVSDFSTHSTITLPNTVPELSFVLLIPVSIPSCIDILGYLSTLVAILVSKEKNEYK